MAGNNGDANLSNTNKDKHDETHLNHEMRSADERLREDARTPMRDSSVNRDVAKEISLVAKAEGDKLDPKAIEQAMQYHTDQLTQSLSRIATKASSLPPEYKDSVRDMADFFMGPKMTADLKEMGPSGKQISQFWQSMRQALD